MAEIDSGSAETTSSEPAPSLNEASKSLDEWANIEDEAPVKPKPTARTRGAQGKFARATDSQREATEALRATVEQGSRPSPSPGDEEAPEADSERQEATPKRRVKGVVNGREEEIEIDSEEFKKLNSVQAMRAAQEAFRQAAEMKKEAELLKQALQIAKGEVSKNPFKLLEQLGLSRDQLIQFAQQQVYEKVAETVDPTTGQPYTPEQQRIRELQNQLKYKEQQELTAKQQQEQQEMEQMKDVMRKDIDRTFTEALRQTGLPATSYTMMRLADLMETMGPDVEPRMLAPIVYEDMVREISDTLGDMPMEVAISILPKKFIDGLRQYDLKKAKDSKTPFKGQPRSLPGNSEQRAPKRGEKVLKPSEAEDWLDKWANQR